MKLGDLVVGIGANTKELDKGIGKAMRQLKYFGKNTKQLGKNLTMGVTAPIAALGVTAIKAFQVQAKAIAQVEAGLKSTGGQVGYTSKQLQQMASDLQSKTLFGDEQILQDATAQLLTFTNISGEQFARTQQAALDLATRLDGDLKGASIQLGKALNDPVANLSALSRSGIQFSEEQKEVIKTLAETGRLAEAQTLILDELNNQYGGSAEAAAKADGGFTQLANSFGDLQEQFGAILVDVLQPVIEWAKGMLATFQDLSPQTKKYIVIISGIAAAIGPLLFIIPQIAGALSLLTGPVGLTIAAIALLATAIYMFADEVSKPLADVANYFITLYNESDMVRRLVGYVKTAFVEQFKIIWSAVKSVSNLVIDLGKALWQMITMDFSGAWETIKNGFADAFSTVADQAVESGKAIAEGIAAEVAREPIELVSPESIAEGIRSLGGLKDAFDNMFSGGGGGGGGVNMAPAMKGMAKKTQEAITSGGLVGGGGPLAEMAAGMDASITTMEDRINAFKGVMYDVLEGMADSAAMFGNEIGYAFGQMAKGAENGAESMKNAAKGIINQALAVAQAAIIEAMINSGKFSGPAAPIVIPALVAGGIGLVQGLFNDIPAFAAGGIVSGPTVGLMGEYPGAKTNPEVIAPLDKLQSMLQADKQQVVVSGRIDGNAIRLANDRTNRNAKRFLR
jgi:hypothetical protein